MKSADEDPAAKRITPTSLNPWVAPIAASRDPGESALVTIETARAPRARCPLRDAPRRKQVAAVRALLRDLGVEGTSVRPARDCWSSTVRVRLARSRHDCPKRPGSPVRCTTCGRILRAQLRLRALILAAFPDLDTTGAEHLKNPLSIYAI